jgi:hypothetical protein
MERIAIVIGICIVAAILVPMAMLMASARLRKAVYFRAANYLEREKVREVYRTAYDFTTSISARQLIDAIEQRWGRTVPVGEPEFYVQSTIEGQQVILVFGHEARPQIFSARIDFASLDPASGTLWFFDAEDDDLIGAAGQLRSDFDRFISDMSPGSVVSERQEPVVIATWFPKQRQPGHRRQPGHHHRRGDDGAHH